MTFGNKKNTTIRVSLGLICLELLATGCGGGSSGDGSDGAPGPSNVIPAASSLGLSTQEDESVTGQVQASDPDGDDLTFRVIAGPTIGDLQLDSISGSFTYTPDPDAFGTDEIRFVASDGVADSNAATITIDILPVNDAPVAEPQSVSVLEDEVLTGQIQASDVDGDQLTFSVISSPSLGQLSIDAITGAFEYQPLPNVNGSDTFRVTAADASLTSAEVDVSISISPVNDIPVLSASDFVIDKDDVTHSFVFSVVDPDSDTISLSIKSEPTYGVAELVSTGADYTIHYEPSAGYFEDSLTVSVSDGIETFDVVFSVTILDANQNGLPDFWDPSLGTAQVLDGILDSQVFLASDTNYLIETGVRVAAGASLVAAPGAQILMADNSEILLNGEIRLEGAMDRPVRIRPASINPVGWRRIAMQGEFAGAVLDSGNNYVSGSRFSFVEIAGFGGDGFNNNVIEVCTTTSVSLHFRHIFMHSDFGSGGDYFGRCATLSAPYEAAIFEDSVIRFNALTFRDGFPSRFIDTGNFQLPSVTLRNSILHGLNQASIINGDDRVIFEDNFISFEPFSSDAQPAITVALWNSDSDPAFHIENNLIYGGIRLTGTVPIVNEIPPVQNNVIMQGSARYVAVISVGNWPSASLSLLPNYWTFNQTIDEAVFDGMDDISQPILDLSNALPAEPPAGPSTMDWDNDGVADDVDRNPLISTIQ